MAVFSRPTYSPEFRILKRISELINKYVYMYLHVIFLSAYPGNSALVHFRTFFNCFTLLFFTHTHTKSQVKSIKKKNQLPSSFKLRQSRYLLLFGSFYTVIINNSH